jgi:2-aminophenol/2-amino-5-chlorophenol 1,6-dioxygenase alpha subunit
LAEACVQGCRDAGIHARGVDYDQFPIDTGTITVSTLMGFGTDKLPVTLAANNLYHDNAQTEQLSRIALQAAAAQGKRAAVIGIGGLSNTMFREPVAPESDRLISQTDDDWNRRMLALLESGDAGKLRELMPEYAGQAKAEMGFKHMSWLLGALGDRFRGANVLEYAPLYGSGGAVVEFKLD